MRLMHCPFCGEDEQLELTLIGVAYPKHAFRVVCNQCDCSTSIAESLSKQNARAAAIGFWNRRVTPEQDTALRVAFKLSL